MSEALCLVCIPKLEEEAKHLRERFKKKLHRRVLERTESLRTQLAVRDRALELAEKLAERVLTWEDVLSPSIGADAQELLLAIRGAREGR